MSRPLFYKSEKTGKEYPYDSYAPHGYGGIKAMKHDLPHDEYPYTVIYEDPVIYLPAWMKN